MRLLVVACVLVLLLTLGAGCVSQQQTIRDTTVLVKDKAYEDITLTAGTYRVMLNSDENIDVIVSGAANTKYNQQGVKAYDNTIELKEEATLRISNPALVGLGPDANVKVKIVKNPS